MHNARSGELLQLRRLPNGVLIWSEFNAPLVIFQKKSIALLEKLIFYYIFKLRNPSIFDYNLELYFAID